MDETHQTLGASGVRRSLDEGAVASLRQLVGDEPEVFRGIVSAFLQDAAACLDDIHHGLEDGDTQRVRRAAHTLAGNGLTFGALDLAAACRELEDAARRESLDGADGMAGRIAEEWRRANPLLEELLR